MTSLEYKKIHFSCSFLNNMTDNFAKRVGECYRLNENKNPNRSKLWGIFNVCSESKVTASSEY